MTPKLIRALAPALVLFVAACGDSSTSSFKVAGDKDALNLYLDSLCDEITGGNTQIEFSASETCIDCASESDANAVDGADATFATLNFPSLTQGPITFRATAQDGVVYPSGGLAGVTFSAPQSVNDVQVLVRTYLDGVEQDRDCESVARFEESERVVIGLEATRPFDALEVTLERNNLQIADIDCGVQILSASNPNQAVNPVQIRVHEFCHEFRLPN